MLLWLEGVPFLALIHTRWRIFEAFLMLLTCFCVSSRQTGALNRIIDRGSRAINYILTVMVFNVVPTILEVCVKLFLGMLWSISYVYCLWCFSSELYGIYILGFSVASALFLLLSFTDRYGVKHTCLQVWFHFCLDYISFSCYLYCFHFGCNTGENTMLSIISLTIFLLSQLFNLSCWWCRHVKSNCVLVCFSLVPIFKK